jgi:excisionase family DNA binding protein
MPNLARTTDSECVLLTVEEAARRLGVGRSTAFCLVSSGRLPSVRIGHLRRIPVAALTCFVAQLQDEAARRGESQDPAPAR